jgi:hypothetical protein
MLHRGRLIVRLVGPRPVALARTFAFLISRRQRRSALRRAFHAGHRPPFSGELQIPRLDVGTTAALPEALRPAAERLREEAVAVVEHRVRFLGSGWIALGSQIDWHRDFKTGYRWPALFYEDVDVTRLDDPSDAKVPWELSRGHQMLTLARAAALFQEELYARELELQLASWVDANPSHVGINWTNPMEVGLRAVNWIWAVGTLETWRPLESELRRRLALSLVDHGVSIWSNLEGTPYLRSNHYLADLLGLLAIGSVIEGYDDASRWAMYGRRGLEREIRRQVYDDGVSFEGSLPYHGLALEMFVLGRHICACSAKPLSGDFDERLRRMLAVSRAARHPNGRIPIFGDQDSGRVLPAGFDRPPTHDNLIWLGAAILGLERPFASAPDEEVAWTLGIDAWHRLAMLERIEPDPPVRFPTGRIYVLRSRRAHCVIQCGDTGQKGNGGHGHNDTFSYELSLDSEVVVVDSGTYTYTADVAARNAFRSTRAHSTVVVDDQEINEILPELVFELRQTAEIRVDTWQESAGGVVFAGSHTGYSRLPDPVTHMRRIRLDRQTAALTVEDVLHGRAVHKVTSFVHLASHVEVDQLGPFVFAVRAGGVRAVVKWSGVADVSVEEGSVSDRYGVRASAPVLAGTVFARAPVSFGYEIRPDGD